MPSHADALASFIDSAPPGELSNVTAALKNLSVDDAGSLKPAYKKYNEEQLTTVKLPGGSQLVIVSKYNELEDGRYYDIEARTSWAFDHATQKASAVQTYVHESSHEDLVNSLYKALAAHASEHYPSSSIGVFPIENDSKIALVTVANKYSPNNYWNGRWRSVYVFTPAPSPSLTGSINVDVHYYEDGNVRLLTSKPLTFSVAGSPSAADVLKQIAQAERRYQEELHRGFTSLSENAFKSLRRQLPVTRQKVEWEKIGGYRVGQDIGGGRQR
ncbi:F-actin-capping protein-like protein subunit alpha-1 [Trichodelitschia bisporula]|uniref:F-actin-capping protein subunit alpha n=1 Tax=Trichodelitschia bisporula TaxID=703511 RepID=A0A6G1HSI5_9PEZI|nr:F-actin-capping protein-like protein subunit alpha-1 [Trichodelitschia bisporula]